MYKNIFVLHGLNQISIIYHFHNFNNFLLFSDSKCLGVDVRHIDLDLYKVCFKYKITLLLKN